MSMEGRFRLITPRGAMGVLRFGITRMPKERQENTKVTSTFSTPLRPGTAFTDRKVRHLNYLSWLITRMRCRNHLGDCDIENCPCLLQSVRDWCFPVSSWGWGGCILMEVHTCTFAHLCSWIAEVPSVLWKTGASLFLKQSLKLHKHIAHWHI